MHKQACQSTPLKHFLNQVFGRHFKTLKTFPETAISFIQLIFFLVVSVGISIMIKTGFFWGGGGFHRHFFFNF